MAFETTKVSVEKTKTEMERLLIKYGATSRMTGADDLAGYAFVGFALADRQMRVTLPLPKANERRFTVDHLGYSRSVDKARTAWEQACRARWRCLLLLVKAKLEAIAIGGSTVEREFLADIYLANGQTVHEALSGSIAFSYSTGKMPPLLGPPQPTIIDAVEEGNRG